ncbi:PD40 domain-containing protein [Solirubrum puertoriconensis]|uniref:Xaa-Pro aminopeptidase n=1 Tax=Solirubrum puertoriconensis TaxID=1751427 RepID=A0A9X0L3P2_SOLP1|nr:PD40 domain-containing protein [Solirubrum puertoriconensis]KUG06743.1 hypothetical protein ASU33_05270 [Solirubrum puertoriconensis]
MLRFAYQRLLLRPAALGLLGVVGLSCTRPATTSQRLAPVPDFSVLTAAPAELVGPGTLSTEANEYNPSLTPDGRTLVFARSKPDFQDAHIFISRMERGQWQAPQPVAFTDGRYADSDPTFSPDGRTLYFASDRPTAGRDSTRRDLDLWQVTWNGRTWGPPQHLGPDINGKGMELGPSFHEGYLYFSSARRSGHGGLDAYRSRLVQGRFEAPENLGPELNSKASESDFEVTRDGRWLLFWSDRGNGLGGGDLYAAPRTETGWGAAVHLPGGLNSAQFDFTPTLSADGQWLYFGSMRTAAEGAPANVLNGQSNLYRVRLQTGKAHASASR